MQQTLCGDFRLEGIGLHTGAQVCVEVGPAPPGTGFVFERVDLAGSPRIPAHWAHVKRSPLASCLEKDGVKVATVEHLLSALFGLGVDNALIRMDAPECPVLDGSALLWCEAIFRVGICEQDLPRKLLRGQCSLREGERGLEWTPGEGLRLKVSTDFPWVGKEELEIVLSPAVYLDEVAWARTFGFQHEIEALHSAGLALGGSLENALVLGLDGPLKSEGLRGDGEIVRHKMLDLIGDLALAGGRLQGRLVVERPGHAFTHGFLKAMAEAGAQHPSNESQN